MKIAGRKNDGAWYRANRMIQSLDGDEIAQLSLRMQETEGLTGAWTCLVDFMENTGLTGGAGAPTTEVEWCDRMAQVGIPRQVWFGRLSYDTYTRAGSPGNYTYNADHDSEFHEFGKNLRKTVKEFTFQRRQILDLQNFVSRPNGNPGGIANAEPGD